MTFNFNTHYILKPDYSKPMIPHTAMDPNVVVFSIFPGIQESIVRHVLESPELRGIVMRSFGSGNAPQKPWLLRLLKDASLRGVTIVNITQCISGSVEMGRYDAGYQLKEAGVVSGYDSTVESAVTKLMYLQAKYTDNNLIRSNMTRCLCGEMTK